MDSLPFLSEEQVRRIREEFGTPVYVYDEESLRARAREVLAFPNAFGLTVRYAMKASSNAALLRLFTGMGIHIDASSGFEAERAMLAGVPPQNIQITAQELPKDLKTLCEKGVLFNACSLHQLRSYGQLFPGTEVCIRVNPGMGSGHNERTNTGGISAGFGIWHEYLDQVFAIQQEYDLHLTRMHTHIGSGSDPETWQHCAKLALDIAARLPEVQSLSLGGGYKVARMPDENATDLQLIGAPVAREFEAFYKQYGRKLHLEIEPGTYLVANAAVLIASVIDVIDTGSEGYRFVKVDSGMTEVLRPGIYGAQHPLTIVPADDTPRAEHDYIVTGHCCESGDIWTPKPGDPEGLNPRRLTEARIGDALVVGGAGAYCSAMAAKNYNSFPEAAEVLVQNDGRFRLIRKRQTLDQMVQNEV